MKIKKGKLFWSVENHKKFVSCIPYEETEDISLYVRECLSKGYRQIIVTSDIMIELIKEFACKRFAITKIRLQEDNPALSDEITALLTQIESNPAYLVKLIDLLNLLAAQSFVGIPCTEITRIELKGTLSSGAEAYISIQINGIVGINKEAFCEASSEISEIINKNLFGEEIDS